MSARDRIDRYLAEVEAALRLGAGERRRVAAELRSHFEDALAAELRRGTAEEEAAAAVLARMGAPRQIAARYAASHPLLDAAVLLGAVACAGVAGWLLLVTATVLPRQDPADVGVWGAVAIGFAAYAGVGLAYLRLRRHHRLITATAAVVSIGAILAGAWFAIPMLLTSGDFEGYVALIGIVLAGQGGVVIVSALIDGRRVASVP